MYWWEKRWRDSAKNPQQPQPVIFSSSEENDHPITYDLIYIGGALGAIHAAQMAKLGYRVLLVERLPFGRMNRESLEKTLTTGEAWYWSRSRQELWHKGATSGHIQKVRQIRYDSRCAYGRLCTPHTSASLGS